MERWSYATELKFTAVSASVVVVPPDELMATLVMLVVLNRICGLKLTLVAVPE